MGRRVGVATGLLLLAGLLAFGQACPTVCVIIPGIPRPIPDPAAETATNKWKEIKTPAINIPVLDLLFRGIACWVTVDARVLDLNTAEFEAYEVTVNVTGIEIFGFRFGCSPQDLARTVAREIAGRVGGHCRGR